MLFISLFHSWMLMDHNIGLPGLIKWRINDIDTEWCSVVHLKFINYYPPGLPIWKQAECIIDLLLNFYVYTKFSTALVTPFKETELSTCSFILFKLLVLAWKWLFIRIWSWGSHSVVQIVTRHIYDIYRPVASAPNIDILSGTPERTAILKISASIGSSF